MRPAHGIGGQASRPGLITPTEHLRTGPGASPETPRIFSGASGTALPEQGACSSGSAQNGRHGGFSDR